MNSIYWYWATHTFNRHESTEVSFVVSCSCAEQWDAGILKFHAQIDSIGKGSTYQKHITDWSCSQHPILHITYTIPTWYQSLQRIFKRTTLSVDAGARCRWVLHRAVDLLIVDGIGERLHAQLNVLGRLRVRTAINFFHSTRVLPTYNKLLMRFLAGDKFMLAIRPLGYVRELSFYIETNVNENHL